MSILYPLINGVRFDYSSVEINVAGVVFGGVKSINYKWTLDPGEIRGTRSQVVGRTRGQYGAEGSLEMYKLEYEQLITLLSAGGSKGYAEVPFLINVGYSENVTDVMADQLIGCRLKSGENSGSEGNEALVVKCDLHIMRISENGKHPIDPSKMLR